MIVHCNFNNPPVPAEPSMWPIPPFNEETVTVPYPPTPEIAPISTGSPNDVPVP